MIFPIFHSPGGDLRQRHGAALPQRRQDKAGGTAAAEGWLWQRPAGRSNLHPIEPLVLTIINHYMGM